MNIRTTWLRSGLVASLVHLLVGVIHAAEVPAGFTDALLAGGLTGPTAMAFAPDGRLFVAEERGTLRIIKNGILLPTPFLTVSVDTSGERGLLGVAIDPEFAVNRFVYVYYTVPSTPRHNRLSRFTANGDVAVAGSQTILLELDNLSAGIHNGGAIHFGPDGMLYIAVGDNSVGSNAQSLSNLLGKILRINKNGTIPSSNPFFTTTTGRNRAIWARGLRNPFTFAFDPGSSLMFINDVGQSTWEEIDDGVIGANYGWPTTEGPTSDPDSAGRAMPIATAAVRSPGVRSPAGRSITRSPTPFRQDTTATTSSRITVPAGSRHSTPQRGTALRSSRPVEMRSSICR